MLLLNTNVAIRLTAEPGIEPESVGRQPTILATILFHHMSNPILGVLKYIFNTKSLQLPAVSMVIPGFEPGLTDRKSIGIAPTSYDPKSTMGFEPMTSWSVAKPSSTKVHAHFLD